jgi:2-oxoglutarate ferredoxin oxidoreductase subunit alpha
MSNNEILKPGVYYLQGAQACLEGAITAGCRVYAGYPITPATEIMEHAAHRLPRLGGRFIQMEDEISSASVLLGASWAGAKAMTATSSPGFSLMQEVISFAIMTETPLVIVDVQRPGPGQGYITTGQEDVMQARWGHHGEGSIIALSPASVQEMFEFTIVPEMNLGMMAHPIMEALRDRCRRVVSIPSLGSLHSPEMILTRIYEELR